MLFFGLFTLFTNMGWRFFGFCTPSGVRECVSGVSYPVWKRLIRHTMVGSHTRCVGLSMGVTRPNAQKDRLSAGRVGCADFLSMYMSQGLGFS